MLRVSTFLSPIDLLLNFWALRLWISKLHEPNSAVLLTWSLFPHKRRLAASNILVGKYWSCPFFFFDIREWRKDFGFTTRGQKAIPPRCEFLRQSQHYYFTCAFSFEKPSRKLSRIRTLFQSWTTAFRLCLDALSLAPLWNDSSHAELSSLLLALTQNHFSKALQFVECIYSSPILTFDYSLIT